MIPADEDADNHNDGDNDDDDDDDDDGSGNDSDETCCNYDGVGSGDGVDDDAMWLLQCGYSRDEDL
jgi:hypothetical protein